MTTPASDTPPLLLACRRCGQMTTWHHNPFRPFCSERCKLIDLGAWASESYSIPAENQQPDAADDER